MAYKEYTILLERTSSFTIKDYDEIVKVSSAQYASLSAPILAKQTYVPSRAVTASYDSLFTKIATYQLTDAEAATFRTDPDVKFVVEQLDDSSNDPVLRHFFGDATGSDNDFGDYDTYLKTTTTSSYNEESFISANFRTVRGPITDDTYWDLPVESLKILGNPALYLHSLPSESVYSSSAENYMGNETWNLIAGNNNDLDNVVASHENLDVANYAVDGRNVDIIIMEGSSYPWQNYAERKKNKNSAMDFAHPDWYGLDGKHRVQFIDWREYTNGEDARGGDYAPARNWNGGTGMYDGTGVAHRQMVGSNAAGVYNGFAKGANIYFFPGSPGVPNNANTVLRFHQSKSINPETGRRNPTVVNLSVGSVYQHPYIQHQLGNLASGSFTFTDEMQGHEKGFRIAWEGQDLIFVSKSGAQSRAMININGRDAGASSATAQFHKGAAGIWYYSGSGLSGLQDVINNNINHWFTASVDISTNQIHLTMSSDGYRAANPKIYTGSLTDFINVDGQPGPRGGEFLTEFSGGYAPNTGISKIVVKGKTILTGSNLFIHSQHGYNDLPPVDHYGIDRKDMHNIRIDPLEDRVLDISSYVSPITTGKSRGELRTVVKMNSEFGNSAREVKNAYWREVAEAGVVVVTSAGNNNHLATQASTSLEENPFYDAELYDDDLYNTYIELDVSYSYAAVCQNLGPHTPLRFHGTSIVNDYQMIQVGLLSYHNRSVPYQTNINTVGTDLKVGDYFNNIVTNPTTDKNRTGFQSLGTFSGAGVDVYAHGQNAIMAGWYDPDLSLWAKSSPTISFYDQIPFDTKKINDVYTQSFMNAEFFSSSLNFEFPPTQSNGDFYFDPQGSQRSTQGGGTSNASPRIAGMVACYLQVNPDANIKDVRNWLKSISVEMPTSHDTSSTYYYHARSIVTSSSDPLKYEQKYYPTGSNTFKGVDLGPRPGRIPVFPYNQAEPVTFTGSLNIEGLNFELQ